MMSLVFPSIEPGKGAILCPVFCLNYSVWFESLLPERRHVQNLASRELLRQAELAGQNGANLKACLRIMVMLSKQH